ncbi:hypothetical protein [Haloparvum sedimenti]|uniref:hypothetical protein n=1 Tax=Haloparvum sedimenti TaxID=1678448 RepID=UPI00071E8579|nr:hypothetical protein [Haloparvum sedimenti]
MPRCVRCDTEMEPKSEGLLAKIGLAGRDGYECTRCGALLCSECFKRRTIELAGTPHERCPTCEGTLEKR